MRIKLFLFIYFYSAVLCTAQTYNFRNYSENEGLHQNYIYCISQSGKGYLNLSTGEGFCTFDGNKFHYYSNKQIAENFVTTHYTDLRDITWLGHTQKGISYLKNGKFFSLGHKQINDYKITAITGDKNNNIWVSSAGGGIARVDSALKLQAVKSTLSVVNGICFDQFNNIIAATSEGIKILKVIARDKLALYNNISFFNGKNIKHIVPTNKTGKSFWVTVEGDGIYGIVNKNGRYEKFLHLLPELISENNNITCIYTDQSGNLWVSLFGEGLRKISFQKDAGDGKFSVSRIEKNNGLSNQHIQSIYQDAEGNMWFGTFGGGLIEKPVEKFSFFGTKEGIENANIKTLATDSTGNIFIGTEQGLACLKKADNTYIKFNSENGFINDRINCLLFDSRGTLWVGTAHNGIFTRDSRSGKFTNFSKSHHLEIPVINTLIQAGDKIFAGTTEGIYVHMKNDDSIELLTTEEGLLHNNIVSLFADSHGRLWVSSHGSPPYFIKDKHITAFKDIPGLNSFNINCVTEDKNGNIWIATEGDGAFKYDNRTFTNYTTSNGLLSNYCVGIEVDGNNSVWVAHRTGLSEKKDFHKEFYNLTNQNGLLFYENNMNSIHKDEFGNLWYGTTQGIVHYDCDMGGEKQVEPKLFITKIKFNDDAYPPGWAIKKKYGYYSVQIDYLAVSLTDPKSIKYKYRLLGIDSSWKNTNLPYADFPRLSDGNYTFQVIACNANGMYSLKPVEISFVIEPPVWKKTWFYILLITVVVLFTYIVVYVRIRNLKKVQALLKETVRQKTFLLQKEKEQVEKIKIELERKNKDITDSINYARRLQDSLLPPDHVMNKLFFKKFFILYKPKDIVSGDFYWSASLTDPKDSSSVLSLAAVVDCTGHGVPGAFLSIVGNDFLKQSITEKNVRNTNDILDFLNRSVISNLNQSSNSKIKVKDGMDIALIAIDYKNHKLYYSGANNPAYVYRKINDKTELFILKPNKQAIGQVSERTELYTLHEFDLLAGDTIYLFSDGYADQFGGDKDKKLNYKRFKEILSNAFELPIGLQKNFIEKKLLEWKRETDQTDDICVMGIRI